MGYRRRGGAVIACKVFSLRSKIAILAVLREAVVLGVPYFDFELPAAWVKSSGVSAGFSVLRPTASSRVAKILLEDARSGFAGVVTISSGEEGSVVTADRLLLG